MKKMKIKSSHYLCRSANDYSFSVCYGQQSSSHLVYVCVYDVHLLAACVLSVCRIHLPNTVRSTYTHLLDTCHSMSYVLDDFYVLCRCASWLVVGRMQRLIASLECDIYGVNGRKWRPNEWADHPAICTNEFHSAWFWKFMALSEWWWWWQCFVCVVTHGADCLMSIFVLAVQQTFGILMCFSITRRKLCETIYHPHRIET